MTIMHQGPCSCGALPFSSPVHLLKTVSRGPGALSCNDGPASKNLSILRPLPTILVFHIRSAKPYNSLNIANLQWGPCCLQDQGKLTTQCCHGAVAGQVRQLKKKHGAAKHWVRVVMPFCIT